MHHSGPFRTKWSVRLGWGRAKAPSPRPPRDRSGRPCRFRNRVLHRELEDASRGGVLGPGRPGDAPHRAARNGGNGDRRRRALRGGEDGPRLHRHPEKRDPEVARKGDRGIRPRTRVRRGGRRDPASHRRAPPRAADPLRGRSSRVVRRALGMAQPDHARRPHALDPVGARRSLARREGRGPPREVDGRTTPPEFLHVSLSRCCQPSFVLR